MGNLGQYLRDTREARGIDLRDAAQQTRISVQYLKALEDEDFSRLPGEVFVKGFLRNYSRFLNLDEAEVMKQYADLKPPKPVIADNTAGTVVEVQPAIVPEKKPTKKISIEPFAWVGGTLAVLILFFFFALPSRQTQQSRTSASQPQGNQYVQTANTSTSKQEKIYLEVVALENTWILVRVDTSPQKKAVLQKGEKLTWSADDRFQVSYGNVGALKLALNGHELTVNEPRNSIIRDLTITAAGIMNKKNQQGSAVPKKPRQQPSVLPQGIQPSGQQPVVRPQQPTPSEEQPARTQKPSPQAQNPASSPPPQPPNTGLQRPSPQ